MDRDEEKPRKLPDKFRASADPADGSGIRLLQLNDEEQARLGAAVNSPFASATPLQNQMQKALVTIDAYSKAEEHHAGSIEVLAEAYATVGQYDLAAELSKEHKAVYRQYWKAVWLDDARWCKHGDEHKYIKAYVYSLKENREMPMLACNKCDTWNVLDAPGHLTDRETQQKQLAGATAGMSIADALQWHLQHVKPQNV